MFKRSLILGFVILIPILFSVASDIDSLLLQLKSGRQDQRHIVLNDLAFLYRLNDPQKTVEYATQALEISERLRDIGEQLNAYSNLGLGHRYMGNYKEALKFQLKALEFAGQLKNDSLIAYEYNRLGIIYKQLGAYSIALEYYQKALLIYEKTGNRRGIGDMYNNIGNIYRKRGNIEDALEYFFKTLKIRKELNDLENYANIMNNIGNVYLDLGIYNEALNYHQQSLKVKIEMDNQYGMSISYNNIGDVYLKLNKPTDALEYYLKSYELSISMNNKGGIAAHLTDIGKTYLAMKNYEVAEKNLSESMKIMEEIGDKVGMIDSYIGFCKLYIQLAKYDKALEFLHRSLAIAKKESFLDNIAEIYLLYSEIYGLTHEPVLALENYKNYTQIRDSIFSSEVANHLMEFQLKLKADEFELEKNLLEEENRYQQLSLKKKNQFIYFLAAIVILIMVLIITIFSRYRSNKKANKALASKNKSINEHNLFLKVLMNTIPNPMYYTDNQTRILGWNTAFEDMYNKSGEEILGKSVFDLFPSELASKYRHTDVELLKNKGMQQFEASFQHAGGKIHEVIFYKNTYEDSYGNVAGLLGILLDITERKQAEDLIRRSEQQLRELNATKDKFFSIIAHDLSNPFNAVSGFIHLLKAEDELLTVDQRRQMIENLSQASDSITQLLANLLEWARAQTKNVKFVPEYFNLNEIIEEIHSIFIPSAQQKNINLCYALSDKPIVYADKNMTKTVLRNLVSNAIKFTGEGGKVEILATKINGEVETKVSDNGVGMNQSDLQKLFVIHDHLSTKGTANETGTGLGLILCKDFIDKIGGSIAVTSVVGVGSTFIVRLPAGKI